MGVTKGWRHFLRTVEGTCESVIEVKRSKFITHLVPFSEAQGIQERLKQQHPKANHVVYAMRYLNDYDQIVESSSDDGEPKGCAGLPALNVLRGEEMVSCAVFIVRYFGGIKLGTGGMARAYAQAVKDVLALAQMMPYQKQVSHAFTTSYSDVDRTVYLLKQCEISTVERTFGTEGVEWVIRGSEKQIARFSTLSAKR